MSRGVLAFMVIALLASPVAFPSSVGAQGGPPSSVCGRADPSAARQVLRAFTQDRLGWFRRKYGLTGIRPTQIRLLTDKRRTDTCTRLNSFYANSRYFRAPWKHAYYEAGGYFFASFIDTTDPRRSRTEIGHFAVFDSKLRLVAVLSPK